MADQTTTDYYISWKHEKHRAQRNGKANYEANCDIEISRLETAYPELVGTDCTCPECQG